MLCSIFVCYSLALQCVTVGMVILWLYYVVTSLRLSSSGPVARKDEMHLLQLAMSAATSSGLVPPIPPQYASFIFNS